MRILFSVIRPGALMSLVLIMAVSSCASRTGGPAAGVQTSRIFSTQTNTGAAGDGDRVAEYRIGVADKLMINFLYNRDLNTEVKVRPDGRISLAYMGDVQAAGLTPTELDSVLTAKFKEILAVPEIAVIVQETGNNTVYVLGEVKNPNFYDIKGRLTLVQAISEAGGYLKTANLKNVVVFRKKSETEAVAIKVNVKDILDKGKFYDDITLTRFDIVYVPNTLIDDIDNFVDQFWTRTAYNIGIGLIGWQTFFRAKPY